MHELPEIARPKVLIVDDEQEILVALTDLLEDDYDILAEADPYKALDLLRVHPDIAVIISDQRMPGLPGDRFLARAREISDARSLLLTGYADLDAVVTALNDGKVQAYVHKPWEDEALRALVAEVARHCLSQRALRTEQALLRGLMEALPFSLVFSDAAGRCIRSNVSLPAGTDALAEGSHYPPGLRNAVDQLREETRRTGHAERIMRDEENEDENADNAASVADETSGAWHEMTRWALAWPPEAPLSEAWQVSIDRDVTRRIAVEARLRQAERLDSLGTLTGGIAHDFNNLLAAISGALDMLEDDVPVESVGRDFLTQAQAAVQRGAAMTRRLLQFGRQGGDVLAPVAPEPFLEGVRPLLEQSLRGPDAACRLEIEEIPQNLPRILTDVRQLEMALLNLCVNARDAMPQGGRVFVCMRVVSHALSNAPAGCASDRALAIEIRDEGTGMTPDVQARVFDPFFTTKSEGKGTGLGLSGVYGFITRTHGDVHLASAPDAGTSMTLFLPILDESISEAPVPLPVDKATPKGAGGTTVLVMDDEAPVRRVVAQVLRHEGADAREAGTLQEALALLEGGFRPTLAMLDVRMPDHDGPTCARALRNAVPGIKILYMSGDPADAALEGERLLSKPFTSSQMRLALQELLKAEK